MVVLFDKPVPPIPPSSSATTPHPPSSSSSSSSAHILPPLPPIQRLPQSIVATDRLLPRSAPSRRRPPPVTKDLQSKINLLDLPTETTATIFRYAHKPKDFHFLLPSGAGPLTLRAYNLPLTVSKEWYRRVRPIYYETLRLTWRRIPDFVESVQRYEGLGRCIGSIHVKISGKTFYKVIKGGSEDGTGGGSRYSNAQLCLLIGQYIDTPLATFALCLDTLACVKDLTLRFTDCKGSEVSLQTIASIVANLPSSVQNFYLDCAMVAKQSATNPYPVHICPIIRKHAINLKSVFLSCRFLCQDLFHPDLIENWEPPEDEFDAMSIHSPSPSYPNLECFTIYREGRHDPTPRPCSEMFLFGHRKPVTKDGWPKQFIDYAVQAYKRGSFPQIKRFEIPSSTSFPVDVVNVDAYHPDGKPCSSVFDVLQDDNYWNSNEEIVIDEEIDDDEEWSLPERWWKSKRRGMDKR